MMTPLSLNSHLLFSLLLIDPISTLFPYTTLFRSLLQFLPIRRNGRSGCGRAAAASSRRCRGISSAARSAAARDTAHRSEEHTSELQSPCNIVCRLLHEKKKKKKNLILYYTRLKDN